jgi:hypothetical protein
MAAFSRPVVAGALACLLIGSGGAGCSEKGGGFDLARLIQPPTPSPGPAPDSPSAALRLLEWVYNKRSLAEYGELMSADFQWLCGPTDSAGADWRGTTWTREDELRFARHLFSGGSPEQPAASSINLRFDPNFFIFPDPQYTYFPEPNPTVPRDPLGRWHKHIRTTVALRIGTEDGASFEIFGYAHFFVVRGDSALIPEELRLRGARPDSTRWYIRRWEDETGPPDGGSGASGPYAITAGGRRSISLDAEPSRNATWCALKALYH